MRVDRERNRKARSVVVTADVHGTQVVATDIRPLGRGDAHCAEMPSSEVEGISHSWRSPAKTVVRAIIQMGCARRLAPLDLTLQMDW